jgi:uncharacterized protein (TIGR02996 family)
MSIDEEALRAAIAAAPDDPEPFLVYADFLLQRGDPRGELIMVMHERELRPDDEALLRRQEELLPRSSRALLGGLSKHGQYVELDWQRGFIRAATLTNREQSPARSRLARLVALLAAAPAALLVDELTLVAPELGAMQEAITALEANPVGRLRALTFASSAWPAYDEEYGWRDLPDDAEPFERPDGWPAPRRPLALAFRGIVPRRLPSLVAEADALVVEGSVGNTLAEALVALRRQLRGDGRVQLVVVRPTVNAIVELATLAFPLDGLALLDVSRDVLDELANRAGAFAWAPRLGYAVRPRVSVAEAERMLSGLPIVWL